MSRQGAPVDRGIEHRAPRTPFATVFQRKRPGDDRARRDPCGAQLRDLAVAVLAQLGGDQAGMMDAHLAPQGEVLIERPAERAHRIDRQAGVDHRAILS
jgi:hypothetical protein